MDVTRSHAHIAKRGTGTHVHGGVKNTHARARAVSKRGCKFFAKYFHILIFYTLHVFKTCTTLDYNIRHVAEENQYACQ